MENVVVGVGLCFEDYLGGTGMRINGDSTVHRRKNFELHLWFPRSNRKFIEAISCILNLFRGTLILC